MANDKIYCSKCGAENEVGSSFCKKCGANLHGASAGKPSKMWYLLPIILGAVFLGWLGGIIGYIVLRVRDQKMAKNVLYVGIGTLVLGIILVAMVPSPPPADSGVPEVPPSSPSPIPVATPSPTPTPTPTPTPMPTPTPTPSIITVKATTLYWDYQKNEIAADQKYKGKNIQVSGFVDSIGRDILDTPYITLATGDIIGNVQCMFDRKYESQLAQLEMGDEVTVQGRCSGKILGSVLIRDCTLWV